MILPTDYRVELTADQRQAVEEDRQRWYDANRLIATTAPNQIRNWLSSLSDQDYRDDMARRLNAVKNRINGSKNNCKPSCA